MRASTSESAIRNLIGRALAERLDRFQRGQAHVNQGGQLLVEEHKVIELDLDRPLARAGHAHAVYHIGHFDREYPITFLRETLAEILAQTALRPSA